MITKVFAICLLVEDLQVSRDFYEQKLGLTVNSTDTGFVDYKLGETPLALFEKSTQSLCLLNNICKNQEGS